MPKREQMKSYQTDSLKYISNEVISNVDRSFEALKGISDVLHLERSRLHTIAGKRNMVVDESGPLNALLTVFAIEVNSLCRDVDRARRDLLKVFSKDDITT